MALELSDLLERPDIHAVYLERYRAESIMRRLWRIANGLSAWGALPDGSEMWHERAESGGGSAPRGGLSTPGASVAEVAVPACFALRLEAHKVYLYAGQVERAVKGLGREEREAFGEWLGLRRHSAVFWVVPKHAMVRRSPSASRELERAAMAIAATAEVRP